MAMAKTFKHSLVPLMLLLLAQWHSIVMASGPLGGLGRSERGALKMLFWATDGRNWKNQWDVQNELSDPCLDQWYGIVCDERGQLLAINLANNNLIGSLPAEFARPSLGFLRQLDLSSNSLTGFLPSTLSKLTALEVLRLDRNYFIGSIPSSLGLLTSLKHLSLQQNNLNPIVPDAISTLAETYGCHLTT